MEMKDIFVKIGDFFRSLFGIKKPLSQTGNLTQDDIFNAQKLEREKEMNRILEKINRKGMQSLSKKEKKFLEEQSN